MNRLVFIIIAIVNIIQVNAQQSGYFTDSRDGKIYKTVIIGNQVWMAENLAYTPQSGNYWAYDSNQSNIAKYGYLYDWQTALNVCPAGWHLPSESEFKTLVSHFGRSGGNAYHLLKDGGRSGFNALFGGWYYMGSFGDIGSVGSLWSSSVEYDDEVFGLSMTDVLQTIYISRFVNYMGNSVRCLRD